ncbi:topoisomerase II domain-containing protein [Rhizobium phage RHph_X2_24]|nr:topoisomerase II domain-containing protein [Rhizobium phage RHph_X2_24]
MKAVLTLEGSPSALARILMSLEGGTAVNVTAAITPANSDDDESGDTPAAAGSVDKDGLPWDDRIHSTPATLTSKGVWRKKRGVTDALVSQVETELRSRGVPAQQPQPVAPAPMAPPPVQQYVPVQPMAPPPVQPAQMQQPQPVQQYQQPAPVPVQPMAPPPAPAPVQAGPLDFNGFMQRIQALLQMRAPDGNPLVDAGYLATVAQRCGVNSITDISGNQQLIDYAVQIMSSEGRWA